MPERPPIPSWMMRCARSWPLQKKLPVVLSRNEAAQFLASIESLSVEQTSHEAGLRINEALNLEVGHKDSRRMMIRVRQAKSNKDRQVFAFTEADRTAAQVLESQ